MSENFIAQIGTVSAAGATLILPGQSETQKSYKVLRGVTVAAGDLVLCEAVSGTYVVIGVVTAAN